jgi:hypothetical protein
VEHGSNTWLGYGEDISVRIPLFPHQVNILEREISSFSAHTWIGYPGLFHALSLKVTVYRIRSLPLSRLPGPFPRHEGAVYPQ